MSSSGPNISPRNNAEAETEHAPEKSECQEAVQKLTDFLSHELRPDEAANVQEHLHRCRPCFARFHFEETFLQTLRERASQVRAPAALKSRILELLTSDTSNSDAPQNSGK